MRVRVLVTNGRRTVDLFWVEHNGTDVYCGTAKFGGKRSYHASGKVHYTSDGKRTDEGWHVPLKELHGQFHLMTLAIGSARDFVRVAHKRLDYSGKKSDAVLLIDARAIPNEYQTQIAFGLIERGNATALGELIPPDIHLPDMKIEAQQVLITTSTDPWVYAIVLWASAVTPKISQR